MSTEIVGGDTLARTLASASDDVRDLDQSDNARLIQQRAAQRAPKRSGTLARSVTARDLGKGEAVVGSTLIYAPVIHYGWAAHHIEPNPFLTTAAADSTPLVQASSLRDLDRILSRVRGA